MKLWLTRILVLVGLLCFAAVVWFAAPLVAFGDAQPFDPVWVRLLIIALVWAVVLGVGLVRFLMARKAERALEDAVAPKVTGDSEQLSEKMTEALAVLKKSAGKRQYLYDLPWYVIIGPPGAGKTTALLNSGIKFPLSEKTGGAIAGVGGTRYCDWWFAEDAVLIDTAGRYTTQDSDAEADAQSWKSFLGLLKSNRPRQPINGVIVAIGLDEVLSGTDATLEEHAAAIRTRLKEIHDTLKVDFPVYVLFTKADLIAGFSEYFGSFAQSRRQKVWGATFQTKSRKEATVGRFRDEYDALVARLSEEVTDRLNEEPDGVSRIAIFGFPGQVAMLRDKLNGLVTSIFESSRYRINATMRGFYFSSGTQEGTPIDQVLGAMERSFGAASFGGGMSGKGKSFFLHDLLTQVIFAESGWVSFDRNAVRRDGLLRGLGFALISALTVGLLAAWGMSFYQNRQLVATANGAMLEYASAAKDELARTEIDDPDLTKVAGYLQMLRTMPTGYADPSPQDSFLDRFGFGQRGRLHSAASSSYRQALERMLRPRLVMALERQLTDFLANNNTLAAYETLKVYKLVGDVAPIKQNDVVLAYFADAWAHDTTLTDDTRAQLLDHLKAMLALDTGKPLVSLNGPLIDQAESRVANTSVADRAYILINLTAKAAAIEDFSFPLRAGPNADKVFETTDGSDLKTLVVPGLYTYHGFHDFLLPQLSQVAQELENDQWVLGNYAKAAGVDDQMKRLGPDLLNRYTNDFLAAWNKQLDRLRLRPLTSDKPQYLVLSYASSPQLSPILFLTKAIKDETTLTKAFAEPPATDAKGAVSGALGQGLSGQQGAGSDGSIGARAATAVGTQVFMQSSGLARIGLQIVFGGKSQDRVGGGDAPPLPGAAIEAQFTAYQDLFEGSEGQRPIDALLSTLNDLYKSLTFAAISPGQAAQKMPEQIGELRAMGSRLPGPLARMIMQASNEFLSDATNTTKADLANQLNTEVTSQCQKMVQNVYPFSPGSSRDMQMLDFARLFAPGGVLDKFFSEKLQQYADISGANWAWRQDTPLGQQLSPATLKEFQRAAEIRAAFFPSGSTVPGVDLTISQTAIHNEIQMALLQVNGQVMTTRQNGNVPFKLTWPGSAASGSASLQFSPDMAGRESSREWPQGPWAFLRMVRSGSPVVSGRQVQVNFTIGGRYIVYTIEVGSLVNPFAIRSLGEFNCPSGL